MSTSKKVHRCPRKTTSSSKRSTDTLSCTRVLAKLVNRTLGGIFDSVLSEREVITGWWTDGYRILLETPTKLSRQEVEGLPKELFELNR